ARDARLRREGARDDDPKAGQPSLEARDLRVDEGLDLALAHLRPCARELTRAGELGPGRGELAPMLEAARQVDRRARRRLEAEARLELAAGRVPVASIEGLDAGAKQRLCGGRIARLDG